MKTKLPIKKTQKGFTLLESLMALFVLSIGMLGVAGMQIQSMQAGNVAKQRMLAVTYNEELLERIRSNPAGIRFYANAAASRGCSSGTVCNAQEMAEDDLLIWQDNIDNVLPGTPTVAIEVLEIPDITVDPEGTGRIINIEISWYDRGDTYVFNSSVLVNNK